MTLALLPWVKHEAPIVNAVIFNDHTCCYWYASMILIMALTSITIIKSKIVFKL